MELVVALVTYNSEAVLGECLASLRIAAASIGHWRLVVADNASTDGSVALIETLHPAATVVRLPRNLGYAAGVNAAVAAAGGDGPVLVLNPDVRLEPEALARMLRALSAPGTGVVVPRLEDGAGRLQHSLRREPTVLRALGQALLGQRAGRIPSLGETVARSAAYALPVTADWATGAAMLISRACFDAVGPWDESFFLYSEETDFALRARDAGFALRLAPDAGAVHLGGESESSPRLWSMLAVNRVRLYRRRHGPAATAVFAGAVLLGEAIRSANGAPRHRAALRALVRPSKRLAELRRAPSASPGYVCFSAQDWWYHNRAHSDFQLMRRVAENRTVLFVNSIGMRMPLPGRSPGALRRILRKAASMARRLQSPIPEVPGFHVLTPVLLPFYGSRLGRTVNAWAVRAQVTRAGRTLGIDEPLVVATIPTAWEVVRRLPHRSLVFNRSDKHSAFDEADRAYIGSLEQALLEEADHVLYVSHQLLAEEADTAGDRAHFLDHGVDLELFRPRPAEEEPDDLRDIPHPRIGFFGGFDDYIIDFDLLERLARDLPDAHLVLIGDATCPMTRFDGLPNVHWLGHRAYEDIPRYGSGFDVALMPWLDNEWIRHSNPIKLKEYLALGLPVVSTDFPEAHHHAPWISIAANHDDFVARVRAALQDHDDVARARRRASVAGASWDSRSRQLMALCEPGSPRARREDRAS